MRLHQRVKPDLGYTVDKDQTDPMGTGAEEHEVGDPFEKLRQKVVASQVIEDSVQSFLMMDGDA